MRSMLNSMSDFIRLCELTIAAYEMQLLKYNELTNDGDFDAF